MPNIGNHSYTFAEVNYGGTNRGVKIIINNIGARNNAHSYRLARAYDPHNLDINWYINNYNVFYLELGTAVANYLERNVQQWNQSIRWPNAIHARIHHNGYHAIREDLY